MLDFHGVANNPEKNGKKKYPTTAVTKAKEKSMTEAAALDFWEKRVLQEKTLTQEYYKHLTDASKSDAVHGGIRKVDRNGKAYYKSYLFVPLGEKENLKSKIDAQLDETEAAKTTESLLSELSLLEVKEMVHNDIKPSNIIFRNDHAQLSDFGGAHKGDNGDDSFSSTYTIKYAAPERLLEGDQKHSSRASDVYSMGLVLAEMYGIAVPYNPPRKWTTDGKETEYKTLPVKPTSLKPSDEMKELIAWMTASDPLKRPTAMQALNRFKKAPATPSPQKNTAASSGVLNLSRKESSVNSKKIEKVKAAGTQLGKQQGDNIQPKLDHKSRDRDVLHHAILALEKIENIFLEKRLNQNHIIWKKSPEMSDASHLIFHHPEKGALSIERIDKESESDGEISTESVRFNLDAKSIPLDEQAAILAEGFYAAWKQMDYPHFFLDDMSSNLMSGILRAMVREAIADKGEVSVNALKQQIGCMSPSESTEAVWDEATVQIKIDEAIKELKEGRKGENPDGTTASNDADFTHHPGRRPG